MDIQNPKTIHDVLIDALARASLRGNPVYPPDPRGLVLYRVLLMGELQDIIEILYDERSQINFRGQHLISLATEVAKEAGIAPRWGSGRRQARDGGGFPGYYLSNVRHFVHVYYTRHYEARDQGLRLVADFWAGRIIDAARAHGYTQDPETHLWVPPPKPQQ